MTQKLIEQLIKENDALLERTQNTENRIDAVAELSYKYALEGHSNMNINEIHKAWIQAFETHLKFEI